MYSDYSMISTIILLDPATPEESELLNPNEFLADEPRVTKSCCTPLSVDVVTNAVLLMLLIVIGAVGLSSLKIANVAAVDSLSHKLLFARDSFMQSFASTVRSHPLFERWASLCNAENIVLDRDESQNIGQRRDWSISAETFTSELKHCSSANDLLTAMRFGHREALPGHEMSARVDADQPLTHENVEWSRSVFRPHGCSLQWFEDEEQLCAVLNQFSHLVFIGDSLTRHTYQALFMLIGGDLRYGGLPRMSRQPGLFDSCQCDGQFSEHVKCRTYQHENMFIVTDPRIYGLCTRGHQHSFILHLLLTNDNEALHDFDYTCSADQRPRVLVLQGGVHHQSNATITIDEFIQPALTHIDKVQQKCQWQREWLILWIEYHAQSRLLDARFPHQSREAIASFNAEIAAYLAPRNVSIFPSWNFTMNATSSDGFHYLSDVNFVRANGIINWLHLHTQNTSMEG